MPIQIVLNILFITNTTLPYTLEFQHLSLQKARHHLPSRQYPSNTAAHSPQSCFSAARLYPVDPTGTIGKLGNSNRTHHTSERGRARYLPLEICIRIDKHWMSLSMIARITKANQNLPKNTQDASGAFWENFVIGENWRQLKVAENFQISSPVWFFRGKDSASSPSPSPSWRRRWRRQQPRHLECR